MLTLSSFSRLVFKTAVNLITHITDSSFSYNSLEKSEVGRSKMLIVQLSSFLKFETA